MLQFDSISDTRKIKRSQRYPFSSPSPIISMYLSTTSSAGLITRIEDSQQILLLPWNRAESEVSVLNGLTLSIQYTLLFPPRSINLLPILKTIGSFKGNQLPQSFLLITCTLYIHCRLLSTTKLKIFLEIYCCKIWMDKSNKCQ